MWGFKSYLERDLAKRIFDLVVGEESIKNYKLNDRKGSDQDFLRDKVYELIKGKSMVHDSYLCSVFRDSIPFPTQRKGNCYVSRINDCNFTTNDYPECPMDCRPKNHLDWIKC